MPHDLFLVAACHMYLIYPFVLSWSLLEAMASGAVVIGLATPLVQEVIRHGENGLLVQIFDGDALGERIAAVLADPVAHRHLGDAARREVVAGFDLHKVCLPRQLGLADRLVE